MDDDDNDDEIIKLKMKMGKREWKGREKTWKRAVLKSDGEHAESSRKDNESFKDN